MAPGHVLAAIVAHRLDDRIRAAVAHGKALARHAADVRLTARRTVKADVADDDVLLRNERGPGRREHDDLAARESLAEVIVGVAFECKRHATRHERAEALAGGSPEMNAHRVRRQALGSPLPRDLAPRDRTDHAIHVADGQLRAHRRAALNGRFAEVEQCRDVERLLEPVILLDLPEAPDVGAHVRLIQDVAEVETLRLPVGDGLPRHQAVHAADHLFHCAETELRHELAHVLRDEAHEIDHVLGLTGEVFAKAWILRRHAHRAGVEMADAHHDAAQRDERCSREAEFFRAEQRRDDDIAPCFQLTVGLHDDAAAQVIQHESLMRLGKTQLPRQPSVRDRSLRRSAGATVMAADEHHICMRLRDARSDGADTHLGDQLHAHARETVAVLQVMDQLRQILDRIDVMVRRRRNEADAGRGMPRLRDPRIHLRAGQLPSLARLRALRHLDLQLLGIDEVFARHAEAAGGHLLDGAVLRVTVWQRLIALRILSTLARIALTANAVHRNGECLVRFLADGAV